MFLAAGAALAQQQKPAPPPIDEVKLRAQVHKMDYWNVCRELGKVLRKPDVSPRGEAWERVVISVAGIPKADIPYIRDRRLKVGMDECSVVAIYGKPAALNRTNHAGGRSDQFVYRDRGVYVYTENGIVRAWQE